MKTKVNYQFLLILDSLTFVCCEGKNLKEGTQPGPSKNRSPLLIPTLDPLVVGKEFFRILTDTLNLQMKYPKSWGLGRIARA